MPDSLSRDAQAIWRETITILLQVPKLMTIADGPVLADFCEVRAEKVKLLAAAELEHAKMVKEFIAERVSKREASARADKATIIGYGTAIERLRARENTLRGELGLSPAARTKIKTSGNDQIHDRMDMMLLRRA